MGHGGFVGMGLKTASILLNKRDEQCGSLLV